MKAGPRPPKTKGNKIMATVLKRNDPERARQYFADKMAFTTGPVEVSNNIKQGTEMVVVDVRQAEDYRKGHVPGAINLPQEKWSTYQGLRKELLNVLYCYSQQCHLAAAAALEFAGKGFPVMEMEGGFEAWQEHDLEVEKGESISKEKRVPVTA